jgi:hypothetical protein
LFVDAPTPSQVFHQGDDVAFSFDNQPGTFRHPDPRRGRSNTGKVRMRWLIGTVIVIVVAIGLYLGSAVASLAALVQAVRSGDQDTMMSHVDLGRLRSSLAGQIVGAYLDRIGQSRTIKPFERVVASTIGASVADAMLQKLLAPENLAKLLHRGELSGASQAAAIGTLPALGSLDPGKISDLLQRTRPVSPMEVEFRVSQTTEAEQYAAVRLRFELTQWRLTEIELPPDIVRQLAATLPAKL